MLKKNALGSWLGSLITSLSPFVGHCLLYKIRDSGSSLLATQRPGSTPYIAANQVLAKIAFFVQDIIQISYFFPTVYFLKHVRIFRIFPCFL